MYLFFEPGPQTGLEVFLFVRKYHSALILKDDFNSIDGVIHDRQSGFSTYISKVLWVSNVCYNGNLYDIFDRGFQRNCIYISE